MRKLFRSSNPYELSPFWLVVSYLILGIWLFVALFPLYWLAVTAFKLPVDVASGPKYIPFVDFQPSLHAWQEMLVTNGSDFVLNPYFNTVVIGLGSALAALAIGSCAAYALTRFDYRPKPGLIATFVGCVVLVIFLMNLGSSGRLLLQLGWLYLSCSLRALGEDSRVRWAIQTSHSGSSRSGCCLP